MLKKYFDNIATTLTNVRRDVPIPSAHALAQEIEADKQALLDKSTRVFENKLGHINYYSPRVVEQLAYQKQRLEHYIDQIKTLQAVSALIHDTKEKIQQLEQAKPLNPSQQEEMRRLQKALNAYQHSNNLSNLSRRKDVKEAVGKINTYYNEISSLEMQIKALAKQVQKAKKINGESSAQYKHYLRAQTELEQALQSKKQIYQDVPGFNDLFKRAVHLNKRLTTHKVMMEKLPKGMLDVKRSLFLLHEKQTDKRIKFSDSAEEDAEIERRLMEIQALMKAIRTDYQTIASSGGELNELLYKTSEHYWQDVFVFHHTLKALNRHLKSAQHLSAKGNLVAECIKQAKSNLPDIENIKDNLAKFNAYRDTDELEDLQDFLDESSQHFYKDTALDLVNQVLEDKTKQLFYIPYKNSNYVIDHPAGTDYADTLGNCQGESMMFLRQISGENPTINNICPESDLLNMQLDQSRKLSSNAKVEILSRFRVKDPDKQGLTWDLIEGAIKEPAKSKTGDLCLIKLGGGRVSGREADVGHVIALIKIKDPNPYKYVLYEYGLGTLGFTSEEPLKDYFDLVFGKYIKFNRFTLQKHGELSQQGLDFIQGIPTIKSKKEPEEVPEQAVESLERLLPLAHYGDDSSISLVLERAEYLKTTEQQQIYQALLKRENIQLHSVAHVAKDLNNKALVDIILGDPRFYEEIKSAYKYGIYIATKMLQKTESVAIQEKIYQAILDNTKVSFIKKAKLIVNSENASFTKRILANEQFISELKEADADIVESLLHWVDELEPNEQNKIYKAILDSGKCNLETLTKLSAENNNIDFFKLIAAHESFSLDLFYPHSDNTLLDVLAKSKKYSFIQFVLENVEYDRVEDLFNVVSVARVDDALEDNLVVKLLESGKLDYDSLSDNAQKNPNFISAAYKQGHKFDAAIINIGKEHFRRWYQQNPDVDISKLPLSLQNDAEMLSILYKRAPHQLSANQVARLIIENKISLEEGLALNDQVLKERVDGTTILDVAHQRGDQKLVLAILQSNKFDHINDIVAQIQVQFILNNLPNDDVSILKKLIQNRQLNFQQLRKQDKKNEEIIFVALRANPEQAKDILSPELLRQKPEFAKRLYNEFDTVDYSMLPHSLQVQTDNILLVYQKTPEKLTPEQLTDLVLRQAVSLDDALKVNNKLLSLNLYGLTILDRAYKSGKTEIVKAIVSKHYFYNNINEISTSKQHSALLSSLPEETILPMLEEKKIAFSDLSPSDRLHEPYIQMATQQNPQQFYLPNDTHRLTSDSIFVSGKDEKDERLRNIITELNKSIDGYDKDSIIRHFTSLSKTACTNRSAISSFFHGERSTGTASAKRLSVILSHNPLMLNVLNIDPKSKNIQQEIREKMKLAYEDKLTPDSLSTVHNQSYTNK